MKAPTLLLLLVSSLAIACAGAPTPRVNYLMRAPAAEGVTPVDAPVAIALGVVEVAPYLSDPGLALETGAGRVHSAKGHTWAEPLDAGLRIFLRAQLSTELGYAVAGDAATEESPDFVVDVSVDELHGTIEGAARLVAQWRIARFDGTGKPAAFRFVRSRPLARDGYAALAEAEIALVGELADAIATSVRSSVSPGAGKPARE